MNLQGMHACIHSFIQQLSIDLLQALALCEETRLSQADMAGLKHSLQGEVALNKDDAES